MKARYLIVLMEVFLAAALSYAASAEGLAVSGEACGHTVSLVLPDTWDDLHWGGGGTYEDGVYEVGEWGVIEDGLVSMVTVVATDVWQPAVDSGMGTFGVETREACVCVPGTPVGNTLLGDYAAHGYSGVYEEFGEIWYFKSDLISGSIWTPDMIIFSTIQDGVYYDIVFTGPVTDAGQADVIAGILESTTYEKVND